MRVFLPGCVWRAGKVKRTRKRGVMHKLPDKKLAYVTQVRCRRQLLFLHGSRPLLAAPFALSRAFLG